MQADHMRLFLIQSSAGQMPARLLTCAACQADLTISEGVIGLWIECRVVIS